ncbi:hypothetical protein ATN84_05315 [Paramesorhizobium deserti]|uniref:Anti-sigma factor NepR domain-containing protein n=1 Tax=Paramesorhizobium deserti TaxID=1494590 RepID=A0A135I125_9HYPH|nr:hypothetical protein [Paramesorhizobium deserti]KXF79151.1 hypothetical protein ATN84_05315 [Paramesorhizobium deserti]
MKQKQKDNDDEGATPFEQLDEELRHFGEYIARLPVSAETRRLWEQLQFQLVRQLEKRKEKDNDEK